MVEGVISVYYTLIPTIAGCTLGGGKHTHDLQTKRGYGPIALGYGIQRGLGGIGRLKLPNVSLFKISSVVINTCVYNERHMQTSKLSDGLVCCSASKNVYRNLSVQLYIIFLIILPTGSVLGVKRNRIIRPNTDL